MNGHGPSRRAGWSVSASVLGRAWEAARMGGTQILDLTTANPSHADLVHPEDVYRSLGDPRAAHYDPEPFGRVEAHAAVAEHYRARQVDVAPERIWLCASTSEAYAMLLALLCDPGDMVLTPRPGYPLLDHLADLASVQRVPYPLQYDGRWSIDFAGLDAAVAAAPRARALIAVAPNNPTGHVLSPPEREALLERCAAHRLALVVDEVFADYPIDGPLHRIAPPVSVPTFVLSGLSKVAALPQMKLSWIVATGPRAAVDPLWAAAEIVADTYLSVSTPVQLALPALLRAAEPMQVRIRERLGTNLRHLDRVLAGTPVDRLHAVGGWTVLLRLPALPGLDDVHWALALLQDAGVRVQPGYLFDLPAPPRVAVSLLTPEARFSRGIARLLELVGDRCARR